MAEWWIDHNPPPSQHEVPPWRLMWSDPDSDPLSDLRNVIVSMGRMYGRAFASAGTHMYAYIEASSEAIRKTYAAFQPTLTTESKDTCDPTRKIYPTSTCPVYRQRVGPTPTRPIKTHLRRRR